MMREYLAILGGVATRVGTVVTSSAGGVADKVSCAGHNCIETLGATTGKLVETCHENLKKLKPRADVKKSKTEEVVNYKLKVEKLVAALQNAEKKLKDYNTYNQLLIALFAVGMATANADGDITEEEVADLDEFIGGIAHINLPAHVKETIKKLKDNPPNFQTAMGYVNKLPEVNFTLFESVIEVISASDNNVTGKEIAILSAFRQIHELPIPL